MQNSNQEILDHQWFLSPNVYLLFSPPVSLAEDLSSRLQKSTQKERKKAKLGKGTVGVKHKIWFSLFVNFTENHIAGEAQNTVEFG